MVKERSPQAYAHDEYIFIEEGQLYRLMILQTGDKQDWDLYNRFLNSFIFKIAGSQQRLAAYSR